MENYKSIALRYLKLNKRRSMITVLGVAFTVLVLYILLNAGFSYLDVEKENVLKESNYEMVFYTETMEQIKSISNDSVVKTASVGGWYVDNQEKSYEQALFVVGDSPYHMDKNFQYIRDTYGVDGQLNQDLAAFYLQGYEGNDTYVLILVLLMVSFLFAIFGVGVIRNSIQLSLFEQIKDYGNLRCIGATCGQLKAVIYLQGVVLEVLGVLVGIGIGQLGMWLVGLFISFEMNFHILPVFLIIIAYLVDLYFAMEENCKLVTGMSPVSALKGEFRIRKEKIKRRKRSLYGKLFGLEGDYAYKNLMRSPGRFYKNVGAMFLGIAALIAFLGVSNSVGKYYDLMDQMYKYYQVYYCNPLSLNETIDDVQKSIPTVEYFEKIGEVNAVQSAKKMYQADVLVADTVDLLSHYTDENWFYEDSKDYEKRQEEYKRASQYHLSVLRCYGYDEEDYARYETQLIDGTLEVSENGIVLVNGTTGMVEDEETLGYIWKDFAYSDYKVGDTIDIVDTGKMRSLLIERLEEVPEGEQYIYPQIFAECKEELLKQGAYKTYVVEGIVKDDSNIMTYEMTISIVLPLERFYAFTDTDESCVTGMQYHIDGDLSENDILQMQNVDSMKSYDESDYTYMVEGVGGLRQMLKYFFIFAAFLVIVTTANIINTTASNIHMRRKEFAQLRVIGVSENRLMKMVILEGVITTIVANFWGILIGNLVSYVVFLFVNMVTGIEYSVPWAGMIIGLAFSVAVFCGSVYVGMKTMKQNMASDLAASGE
ncbi:MAG: ABC transporter permease [Lachnospiraceae bacterium]|nr:ABC transporter permease [Lachnospiraceae bacterium]